MTLVRQLVLLLIMSTVGVLGVLPKVRQQEIAEITPTIATQGNTLNNNEECCAAAHAIDKDLSTGAITSTDDGGGWLKLEFHKTYFIHKVVIYFRFYTNWYFPSEGCVQSVAIFEACVNNDNNVVVSVYQGEVKQKSCETLQLTYGLEQSDQIYTLLCNIEGDTLILSKNTGNIVVFEVAVTKTECESFDTTKFPGLEDLSPELPVFPGTILTVKCEKPARFAIISGDKTLTCVQGSTFNFSLIPTCALVGKCTL
ncbi:hypothetical protein ACHWQZ_G005261 [Mnemiopsis leidyi]